MNHHTRVTTITTDEEDHQAPHPPIPRAEQQGRYRRPPNARASPGVRLTSPYGAAYNTVLYRIEANPNRLASKQAREEALERMMAYCQARGACPVLRPREWFPRPSEEQVLYVKVSEERRAWERLRHQAERLGLTPCQVEDTNEIPDVGALSAIFSRVAPTNPEW